VQCGFEISTVDCRLPDAGRKETSIFSSDYLFDQHASVQLISDIISKDGQYSTVFRVVSSAPVL